MPPALSRLLAKSGIVLSLLGLAFFFSVATLSTQVPDGADASPAIVREILRHHPRGASVLIVLSQTPQDRSLAPELERAVAASGLHLVGIVAGDPADARSRLDTLNASSTRIDAFACSGTSSAWRLLSNVEKDFPALGAPRIHTAAAIRTSAFLKPSNLLNIANQIAVIAIVAIGMTMVIIAGGIDLSVGSLIALSAVVASRLIRDFGGATDASVPMMILCALAGIFSTGAVGLLTGAVITRFHVPPFIATLSTMLVASGAAFILADGQSSHQLPDRFVALGRGSGPLGVPYAVLLVAVLYGAGHVLMSHRRIGRHLYAVGGNAEAARLAGVPVPRVTLFAYTVSGLLAGLGGIVMASQLKSGSPTYGTMYELYVIAAVVVGGTSLRGGEGRIVGTLLGTLTIAVIQNGMNLLNIESYTQKVILGLVILAAVLMDTRQQRKH